MDNAAKKDTRAPTSAQALIDRATGSVDLYVDGMIAEIALSNGAMNLVTRPMLRQLNRAISELAGRNDIRCVILHGGTAKAFCAGSDIKEFDDLRQDASEFKILFEDMVIRNLARLPMPTIAALNGHALGGGFEIALACDLRVLQRNAKVGLPESHLGGLAGNGAVRITRLIGPSRAKELLYTGMTLTGEQALEWGLVNRLTDEGQALAGARELAATIIQRGPISNRLAKTLVDAAQDMAIDAALSLSTTVQQQIFDSDDLHRGVEAFFAKRPADFKGN
jgi:1,4-dihydroxy-2-naphthoyl-CoA synthase